MYSHVSGVITQIYTTWLDFEDAGGKPTGIVVSLQVWDRIRADRKDTTCDTGRFIGTSLFMVGREPLPISVAPKLDDTGIDIVIVSDPADYGDWEEQARKHKWMDVK